MGSCNIAEYEAYRQDQLRRNAPLTGVVQGVLEEEWRRNNKPIPKPIVDLPDLDNCSYTKVNKAKYSYKYTLGPYTFIFEGEGEMHDITEELHTIEGPRLRLGQSTLNIALPPGPWPWESVDYNGVTYLANNTARKFEKGQLK